MSAQRKTRERRYATVAKVRTFVQAAKDLGIKVGGFEVTTDGTIRILNEQSTPRAADSKESAFDKWVSEGN